MKREAEQAHDGLCAAYPEAEAQERGSGRRTASKRKLAPNAAATTGIHSAPLKKPFCA